MKSFLRNSLEKFRNLKIQRSYYFEIGIFVTLLFLAFIFREKLPFPRESAFSNVSYFNVSNHTTKVNATFTINTTNQTTISEISNKTDYSFLKERNPFSPEGSYLGINIPENPYVLIAVKLGKPSEALLKSFRGELLKVKVGDKLLDGSKVVKITENSVILKRLGKTRELNLFKIEVEKWKPKKPFGSHS